MKKTFYFNIYDGDNSSSLYKEDCRIVEVMTPDGAEYKTVCGPYFSAEEANAAFERRGAQKYFLGCKEIPVSFTFNVKA